MQNIKRVVAAVIRDGDKVFATARGYGNYKGFWEFPGGKIEPGETPKEALIREIKEELDVDIEVGSLIRTVMYDYPEFRLNMSCYWATIKSGQIILKEAEDARWLKSDDLGSVNWLGADKLILEDIKKELEGENK